jgi:RNA polymerase sigma-70 factor (ECF subfamily)
MTSPPPSAACECDAQRTCFLRTSGNHRLDKNTRPTYKSEDACSPRDAAFSSLVDAHGRLMYRVAYSLLRNAEDAEDAVQEAFLKLYRGEAWRQMNDGKAFLARTVWRIALDRLQKLKEQPLDRSHEQVAGNGDSPETNAIRNAQAFHLRRMIDGLSDDLRQVLVLSAVEDLNSREVGLLIGIPEGTVRTRLMRARDELRRQFEVSKESEL